MTTPGGEFQPLDGQEPQAHIAAVIAGFDPALYASPEARERHFRNLTYNGFVGDIVSANATLLGVDPTRHGFSPQEVGVLDESIRPEWARQLFPRYLPPGIQNRRYFLNQAVNYSQMTQDRARSATIKGLTTVLLHPFQRGNGRTTRMEFALEAFGYDGSPEANDYYTTLLTEQEGRSLLYLHPSRAQLPEKFADYATTREIRQYKNWTGQAPSVRPLGVVRAPLINPEDEGVRLTGEDILDVLPFINEPHFNLPLLTRFIFRTGRSLEDFVEQTNDGPMISAEKVVRSMTRREVLGIFDNASEFKDEFLQKLLYCLGEGDRSVFGDPNEIVRVYMRPPSEDPA